ncbi:MAG: isoprenoid biosynthesis glyoxalase ElbB [Candidatus Sabulitectum sp.]|nr:isoprenoid biosynthesis glyoxalase ElbB [Candidatus Sabulitectum sp.]
MPRIAMLLSGCGNLDGSEIHESVSAIIAIDQKGWDIVFTAPDISQRKTVSYLNGQELPSRNAMQESARIARGRIEPLRERLLNDIDAIVIPGGLGAALTLCDFAVEGAACNAHPEVDLFLKSAHKRGIPIGAMCIAPTLVARCIPGATVTVGTNPGTAEKIRDMGCEHVDCLAEQVHIDRGNRIVTTPAYMTASGPAQVLEGAIRMINALEELISPS